MIARPRSRHPANPDSKGSAKGQRRWTDKTTSKGFWIPKRPPTYHAFPLLFFFQFEALAISARRTNRTAVRLLDCGRCKTFPNKLEFSGKPVMQRASQQYGNAASSSS